MANYWIEPEISDEDKSKRLRSAHLTPERIKSLIVEFVQQFTADEWLGFEYHIGKVYYSSRVDATPEKHAPYYPELWNYEIKARFDNGRDVECLVLQVEHFFRSRYYGIAYREIWVPLSIVKQLVNRLVTPVLSDTNVEEWEKFCNAEYTKRQEHLKSFVCTLRNMNTASLAFRSGLNEKAERVNVRVPQS